MAVSVVAQLMLEIEHDLRELRREYNMFFSGASKVEPFEVRQQIDGKVKRLRNLNVNKTEDRFRSNNLISKVQANLQLWDRQVEKKYSGEVYGPRRKKPAAAQPGRKPPSGPVVIRDPGNQKEEVNALYEEYRRLNQGLGAQKIINYDKFETFITNQTKKIQSSKNVANVQYEVSVQNDKVVIKTKTKKKQG